ncbi:MAG: DNA polymerase III subunit alpha [Saprospiraceae bacterium]|nr:DNA polymerase III subunit alpha [Saprospiraceae bacterium]
MYTNCHSHFSFHYGILSPRALLEEAHRHGITTLALTDINHSGACQDFVRMAPRYGIKPVVGVDFRNPGNKRRLYDGVAWQQQYVGLAINNHGFRELNEYLSGHLHAKKPFPAQAPVFEDVYIIYPYSSYRGQRLLAHEYVGIGPYDLNRFTAQRWQLPKDKVVMLHTATFRGKQDFNAHRMLRAMGDNTLFSKLDPTECGRPGDLIVPGERLRNAYDRYPEALYNTERLLETCCVDFTLHDPHGHRNLKHYTGSAEEDYRLIRQLCEEGLNYRYKAASKEVLQRLEKELNLIHQKGFVSYFLINWHIIRYALQQGYFYVGRGSGANSIVAYLLRITDVDPIELDLYFERFINLYRRNPPDFDIDFSWHDREDITRYIFESFDHVSLLATYSTLQDRAVIRELGKIFGLPKHEIDRIQDGRIRAEYLDGLSLMVRKYSQVLKGLPSHLSVHAGGILICEESIHNHTGTFLPPKGFATTQFDMITAEDIGLYKFDILGQRGLAKIKDCLAIIQDNHPEQEPVDIHDIPRFKDDERIKELLRSGTAIGCFYVESPAMRMLLKKLKVDHYLGLVAASSIIRPGVARSGMMREYILRFRYPERRKEAHPVLLDIMPETFGVMVYQEDVIKVAHYFAGLDLGEADVLRRGMSGKFRSRDEFAKIKDKFFANCVAKGHDPEMAREVWRQIESFAGYAFSKGHSASYAVESYQTLFLKAYYPLEYMVATINNGGGFYRWEVYLHEARMHGAQVVAPCVNTSGMLTIIRGTTIYIGLAVIRELERESIARILYAREDAGAFRNLYDLIRRTGITLDQVTLLIRAGALRFTDRSKKALLWDAHFMLGNTKPRIPVPELFQLDPRPNKLPPLHTARYEDAFDEMEILGLPMCSPFELLRDDPQETVRAANLKEHVGKEIWTLGYMVAVKNTATSGGKRMYFGTFLDRDGAFLDTVHFPPVAAKYPFRGRGIYRLTGQVVEEFGFYSIEVTAMIKLSYIDDPRFVDIPLRAGEKARDEKRRSGGVIG